ncbi:MFS transporter [Acaricomes phytoseiuli]|uniref:MDR family MFS transporter n=1 Tax=Acaricomes phytoseiuli TaxID=291968 RepID=UPI0003619393|nr:MDR family MFS transporter [Acaricomes phytoseiuli]MCW1250472.1 MFS transporter [Acaricomes phytoseiuli]
MSHVASTATKPAAHEAPPVYTRRQIMTVLVGLMLGMFLGALDQTIVSSSIYTIANDLNGLSLQAWATTAYLIASTVTTPLYGKLSDIFGRRPLYLIAIVLFLLGSVYSGFVHSMTELAIARGLQGLGAGGLMSLGLAIIGDMVPLRDRGKYQGYFMSIFGISSVIGPVVGGFFAGSEQILGLEGWRWVFLINVPIAIAAFAVVWRYLHLPRKNVKQRVDYWGAAAITLALVPLLVVAEQGREWGWTSTNSLLFFGLGFIGLAAFVLVERAAGDSALIPLRFFRIPTFGISALLNFIIGIGMFGAIAMLPMYLQIVRGLTPTEAGLMMITFTIGILIGSVTSGQTLSRTGIYRIFPIMGTFLLSVSALSMGLLLGADTSLLVPGGIAIVFGLGLGFCMQPLTLSMQLAVPPKDMGVATSTATFFRSMGGTVGTAVFLSVLFIAAQDKVASLMGDALRDPAYTALLRSPATLADPDNKKFLDFMANAGEGGALSLDDTSWLRSANPELTKPIREGFAQSIDLVMLCASGLVTVAFLVTFFLPKKRLTDYRQAQPEAADQSESITSRA